MIVRYKNGAIKVYPDVTGPQEEHKVVMSVLGVASFSFEPKEAEGLIEALQLSLRALREGN